MRLPSLLVLAILGSISPLITACRSQNLSRAQAGELIAQSKDFQQQDSREILLGRDVRLGLGGFLNGMLGTFDYELADCLAAEGYLSHVSNSYLLTPKGREAQSSWGRDPQRHNARLVPVAQPELIGVTGIVQQEGSVEAVAEFAWRWKWTPIMNGTDGSAPRPDCRAAMARRYGFSYRDNQLTAEEHKSGARFRRFDDGWRLEQIQLQAQ